MKARIAVRRAVGFILSAGLMAVIASVTAGAPAAAVTSYRSAYHFTVPDRWKNDPQRPIYVNGEYQYYYLYNKDYPTSVGTSWRMATSTDGVKWSDQGVVATKFTTGNGSLWSGSTVVDVDNTAGFGAGAVIMLVTQPTGGPGGAQAQFLWYSTDGGRNFQPYGTAPVKSNPGVTDFRDPKVVWDADRSRWVMVLAEGNKIGFYISADLKSWTYKSGFTTTGLGTLECPDLFKMRASDGETMWVLGSSANAGSLNTYAYWTGAFDGSVFTADAATPQWLDYGFDWYAAVTWEDATSPLDRRFAVGWMNNWSYPDTTPTMANDGYNGTDSITRQLRLEKVGSVYSLLSTPVAGLDGIVTASNDLGTTAVSGVTPLAFHGTAYEFDADVTWTTAANVGLQVRRSSDGTRHADVGVASTSGGYSYLNRGYSVHPDASGTKVESHAPFDFSAGTVHLRVFVDSTTVELYVDDGRYVHSSEVFPASSDDGIALYAVGGTAQFSNVTVRTFADIQQRPYEVIGDFEGTTFGDGYVTTGSYVGQAPSDGAQPGKAGLQFADTFVNGGDSAVGTITSPAFTVDRAHLRFLLAGGNHPISQANPTAVQLLVGGVAVETQTGNNSGNFHLYTWDMTPYAGQTAQFQVVDQNVGTWGHVLVDQVIMTD